MEISYQDFLALSKKDTRLELRINSKVKEEAFNYCKQHNITMADLINSYLIELLIANK